MMAAKGISTHEGLQLIPAVVSLFNLFYLLGARASKTHPHPLERGVRIVERFFGSERAEALRRSYEDPTELVELLQS